jgi:signal transduction histidine kinase
LVRKPEEEIVRKAILVSPDLLVLLGDPKWTQGMHHFLGQNHSQIITLELAVKNECFLDLFAGKYRSYIGLPIRVRGSVIGLLSILGDTNATLTHDQNSLLVAILDQISVAVDSARLRKQSEEAAITKERERLARELHDSVTQSLYSLTLMARGWQRGVDSVRPEEIRHWLERIGDISFQALKEMRLLVYDLLPNTLRKDGLGGALKRRLETVEGRLNIATTLKMENTIPLPAKTEQELYRIAQEALNNILKHSEATQATVRLGGDQGNIELEISDNGIGFDPAAAQEGHGLGIANMRTRAERLGGQFALISSPQTGTTILVTLKCPDQTAKMQSI